MLNRFFYFFLVARSTTVFSDIVYVMVISLFIYEITGSAIYAAIFPFISTMGRLVSSFLSPLFVERFGNKKLLFYVPIIIASIVTLFVIMFETISQWWFLIFVVVGIVSLLQGIVRPLFSSSIPMLVNRDGLVKANGLLSFSFQSIQVAGYTLTGLLVAMMGTIFTFYLCVILLWTSWICLLFSIKGLYDVRTLEGEGQRSWDILKEGWVLLWKNHKVRAVTLMDVSEGIAGSVWMGAITLIFVSEALNETTEWWGYINSAYNLGAVVGGGIAIALAKYISKNLLVNMAVGAMSYGVLCIIYGMNSFPVIALLLVLCMGPVYQIRDISQQTILQKSSPPSDLPKIYASHNVLSSASTGFSVLLVGVVADIFGVRWVYILGGALVIVVSCISLIILRQKLVLY